MIRVGSDFSGVDIWKDVPGFIGFYQVSNNGKIRRDDKILKNQLRVGYPKVTLRANGVIKQISVHRLVAKAFIPNPENKPEVNHINGLRTDNRVENLEWCTRKENAQHSYDTKLQKPQKGSSHGRSKLTEQKVLDIRHKKSIGYSLKQLSEQYSIAISTTSQIINRKRWKHL